MCYIAKIMLLLCILCHVIQVMQSGAYIKVKLLTYRNSRGLLSNGQCCESNCQSMCSHKLFICLDPIGSNWVDSCLYGKGTTGVIENKNYITFEDSVKAKDRHFTWTIKSWPGGVFLKINVTNHDENGAKQLVDYFGKNFYLGPEETKQVMMGSRTVLTLEIQVTCHEHFYSHNCSVFCSPQDSDNEGHYTCDQRDGSKICRPDWKGPNCSVIVDDCANVRCRNGGTCEDRKRDFFCNCQSGFTGRLCEADINECLNQSLCQNGQCVNKYGTYICTCYKGFSGRRCESNINDCASSPCQNAGYCIDLVSAYTCRCATGFTGRHCEQDLNECSFRNTCKNGGTCLNLIGSYGCNCPNNFQGYDCSQDVDECQQKSRCQNGGWCSNSVGSYSCHCPEGFKGQDCEQDIDECLLKDKLCENNATCLNTIGSYSCSCSGGYYGRLCHYDINECVRNPCRNGAVCENTPGHYKCLCPQGRTGELCEFDIDECTPGVCLNGGNCFNVPGSYYCECSGYWEGKNCEMNVNECKSHSKLCENNASCQDVVDGYRCLCQEGFFGTLCEQDLDECALGLCVNNVSCANTFGSFHCSCAPGWTGTRCHEDINECLEPVCNNEGVCVNSNGSYHCRCPANWMGQRCEMDIDECSIYENLCRNGGTCVNLGGSYHCKCPPEWAGPMCDVDKAECAKNEDACKPIELSIPFYLQCNVSQAGVWKVNKGLEALLKATRLYDEKRLDVSHRLQRGRALDGTTVTAIYPMVKSDGELLNQQELVYALNKVTSMFHRHMYCPLYLDAVDNNDFVEILTAEKQNWIPGLLTVCGFLLLGILGLSIVKCRRMYTSHRDKCRLQKSGVTRSFRNQLYLETSRGHFQEMVENQINIISTGTVPHYATVDEMRESQTESNSMTIFDAEQKSEDEPPETNDVNVTSGRWLGSDNDKHESVFYMTHPKNLSLATSKQRTTAGKHSSMLAGKQDYLATGKQDPLPALPPCTYYNDDLYSSPACNLGKTKRSKVRAQATSQSCDGAQGPLNLEELYVDVVRRRKLGHPRQRTRSLDDKSLYKKHNPRGRNRFSDVDRKYKHLPYIDDPPFHETLLQPQTSGTQLHPQTHGTLVHPQTLDNLLQPQTLDTLLHPQTSGTQLHPQTSGTQLHPQTSGTILHPQTLDTLLHPQTSDTQLHPQTSCTILQPQTSGTQLQPQSSGTILQPQTPGTILQPLIEPSA